jgi:hypothetical protein
MQADLYYEKVNEKLIHFIEYFAYAEQVQKTLLFEDLLHQNDQFRQQAQKMYEALALCGEQLKYMDDLFRAEGCDNSVVWNESDKALEQFDEFMKKAEEK